MGRDNIKVVILCGGRGIRLGEETESRPKPLVEIGGRPILWHIMKIYSHYGFHDFILCLGYKGDMIREYFLNYEAMNNDFTIYLGKKDRVSFHNRHFENGWKVTLVDTGTDAQTGARIKKVEKYINGSAFMVTYGDGVGNVNIGKIFDFYKKQKKTGIVTAVHPSSRFGELVIRNDQVVKFTEKPQVSEGFINGGFFVFHRKFLSYLNTGDDCCLEREPLEQLAGDSGLAVYKHNGFWQCMDTRRELDLLNKLWHESRAAWKVW